MEKRLISALAVSVLIILAFQYFTAKPTPVPRQQVNAPETAVQAQKEASLQTVKEPLPAVEETDQVVETARYIITFSNVGGAIKEIRLKDYKSQPSGEGLGLVEIKDQSDYLFSMTSAGAGTNLALADYVPSQVKDSVIYTLRVDGWEIRKRYIIRNTIYGMELQLSIKNESKAVRDFDYRIIGGSGISEPTEEGRRLIESSAIIDGKRVGFKRPKNNTIINPGNVKWSALKNKYFSVILMPVAASTGQFCREGVRTDLVCGVDIKNTAIQPGATVQNNFIIYAGPSHPPILKAFGYDLDEVVDYGFFGGISKALIAVMRFFYSLFHSWGIAIILLSIFLNIVLFPLTFKSFQSMQKMQALHPQMEKLKKLHKDNPQKLNKEIMELYKKYKINPFGGCLPMLLQMPIFIALYQALMKSIELRNTSFLWIQDLSSPDAVRIPITLPIVGNSINILPLVMVAAMVMQQKMSSKTMGAAVTDEQKQQQKIMLVMMPIMFGFIFYNMPSGLVLYWVVNTALTIIEQMAVFKNTVTEA